MHVLEQVGNSTYVGCFIFWAPNTIVDSITYGGMILTVRIPEPSYFSERWTQRPARLFMMVQDHHKMPATRVLDTLPSPAGNSTCVGCFIFWVPNTSVDSITYGGVRLTVRKPEPSLTGMSDTATWSIGVYDGSEPS